MKPKKVSSCAQCSLPVLASDVVVKQYYTGYMVDVEHFHSLDCYYTWFVNRLRQWGM